VEKLKFVFLGTPAFAVATLEALFLSEDVDLSLVVSMPDRPAGRGKQLHSPEVIQYAKEKQIPFAQSENINQDEKLIERIRSIKPDVILVLAFAQFLNSTWLQLAKLGVFNIHTSLLPKYRGAAPIQAAILNGDRTTGVSIQKMIKKMDAGDIVLSSRVDIPLDTNAQELSHVLQNKAAEATLDFIQKIRSNILEYIPQDESLVSYASIIRKDDGLLDFCNESAQSIYKKHLAYYPWPGTFFFLNDKRVKILNMEASSQPYTPNELNLADNIAIGCQNGSILIHEAQPEGKRPLKASEFRQWLQNHKPLIITRPQ
jgi:methionyl-tRNA formyltransferase